MRIALHTNIVSPHQLPLAREIVKRIGAENYRYVYADGTDAERLAMGWNGEAETWCIRSDTAEARAWLETCDVLLCCPRDLDLIERRCRKGLRTYYVNERWFKPLAVGLGPWCPWRVDGAVRLLVPGYRAMARRFVALCRRYDSFRLLPIGVHARRDFLRLGVPEDKMTTWGYFVEPSSSREAHRAPGDTLKILWVGRMLEWKRVDVIIEVLRRLDSTRCTLTLVGDGPEKERLVRLARGMANVSFGPPVPIGDVRALMRTHDLYVFPSNAFEGWGAVVSEALEEGMLVVGSNQSGACATLLPESCRFDCDDVSRLASLIASAARGALPRADIGRWTAAQAAERLVSCAL